MILGDKMQHGSRKKEKAAVIDTADILEGLRGVDPIIGHILEFRQLSKLKSTYCRCFADAGKSEDRPHPHSLTRRGRARTTVLQRPQPAEYPHP